MTNYYRIAVCPGPTLLAPYSLMTGTHLHPLIYKNTTRIRQMQAITLAAAGAQDAGENWSMCNVLPLGHHQAGQTSAS